jgi:hypothetical protein
MITFFMPQKPLPLIISLKHWREQNGFSQSDDSKSSLGTFP